MKDKKMLGKLKDNLASIAALIAAVVAIGGGFVKYCEITTKLNQIVLSSIPFGSRRKRFC